jgi:predicted nucleic acid-binding protein
MRFTMMPEADMCGFLDSNIVLYAFSDDNIKSRIANRLLAEYPCISTQVVNECSHVMRRKLGWKPDKIAEELEMLLVVVRLQPVDIRHIRLAWKIAERYGFSHFDSLIVATALEARCEQLFSEDMQSGQIIEDRLRIVNPFLEATQS